MLDSLLDKIKNKQATICILGLGRVGLPFASVLATRGLKVIGIDIKKDILTSVKNSKSPFYDPALQETLEKALKSGNLEVDSNLKSLTEPIDIVVVTVGTPNTVDHSVDYSQLYSALDEICELDLLGKMIIMRSTMPVGSTLDIVKPFLEYKSNLIAGTDFGLAVCPERILEGQAIKEIHELPEIVGGVNKISNDIATELFLIINPKKDILYTSPSGAELVKLYANIYRYISFALSNEFAIWAEKYSLDAAELIRIANYNYPRSNIPIPGFVGGPCLSKDGTFLDNNTTFASITSTAWKLNESIPHHIVQNLKKVSGTLFNKRVTVLGIAFKAGSDDTRNSPSVKLVEILRSLGAEVLIHDPFVKGTLNLSEALNHPDIIVIATNHKDFNEKKEDMKKSGAKLIYDVWSMFKDEDFPGIQYMRFGRGFS